MKKIMFIILCFLLILCSGCITNPVIPNDGKVELYIEENFQSYMPYDEVPTFTFTFNGNLNTIKEVPRTYYTVFSQNEDQILSDALEELFNKYKKDIYIELLQTQNVKTTKFTTLDEKGKVKNIEYTPDDNKIYEETAYIPLDNGLTLTVDYRRFVYQGKNYYTWRIRQSITMWLYYPLMVVQENEEKKLLIVPLPHLVSTHLSPQLKLNNMMKGKEYVFPNVLYYGYNYPDKFETLEEQQKYVREFYLNHYNGTLEEDGTISVNYLGIDFQIVLEDNNFKVNYISHINN